MPAANAFINNTGKQGKQNLVTCSPYLVAQDAGPYGIVQNQRSDLFQEHYRLRLLDEASTKVRSLKAAESKAVYLSDFPPLEFGGPQF